MYLNESLAKRLDDKKRTTHLPTVSASYWTSLNISGGYRLEPCAGGRDRVLYKGGWVWGPLQEPLPVNRHTDTHTTLKTYFQVTSLAGGKYTSTNGPIHPHANFLCSLFYLQSIEFFTVCTKLAEIAILYSNDLATAKKKLPPVVLDLVQEIIASLGVQCLTIWAKLACAIYGIFKLLFMHHLIFGLRGTDRI